MSSTASYVGMSHTSYSYFARETEDWFVLVLFAICAGSHAKLTRWFKCWLQIFPF